MALAIVLIAAVPEKDRKVASQVKKLEGMPIVSVAPSKSLWTIEKKLNNFHWLLVEGFCLTTGESSRYKEAAAECSKVPQMAKQSARKAVKAPFRVSVVLAESEYDRLAKMATSAERSMSWLGRYAIRRLLKDHEGGQIPLPLQITNGA